MLRNPIIAILRAGWVTIAITVACCMLGGVAIILTAAPRYQASARVVLEFLKPNPVTGAFIKSQMADAYVATQIQMIKDYQVAIPAADALGMLDSIDFQTTYASIPGADPNDFPRWAAKQVIGSTNVRPVEDSNILEIINTSPNPDRALATVQALRDAYIQSTLDVQRAGARANAASLSLLADKIIGELREFEARKAALEQRTGVMPNVDKRRLADLVTARPAMVFQSATEPPSAGPLAAAELKLAEAVKNLGPNNPGLISLRSARDALKAQVDRERTENLARGSAAGLMESAKQAEIETQRTRVLSQSQTQLELKLLQDQIDTREQALAVVSPAIARFKQLTSVQEAGLTPLGDAEVKPTAVFPNHALILTGTGVLGLLLGGALTVFLELLQRRARSAEALSASVGAPNLGVVPHLAAAMQRTEGGGVRWWRKKPRGAAQLAPKPHAISPALVTLWQPSAAAAYQRLADDWIVHHLQHGRRGLAVCGASSGAGVSLTAANLAVALSQRGVETLLVETDLRRPALHDIICPRIGAPGLQQLLRSEADYSEVVDPDVLPNLSVLFSGGAAADAGELLSGAEFRNLLGRCMREYRCVVLDTPPANRSADTRVVAVAVGHAVIVGRRSYSYLDDASLLSAQLRQSGVNIFGSIFNDA